MDPDVRHDQRLDAHAAPLSARARGVAVGAVTVVLGIAYTVCTATAPAHWQLPFAAAAAIAVGGVYFALGYDASAGGRRDADDAIARLRAQRRLDDELDRAFDLQDDERAVLATARAALRRIDPDRLVEIHLVDPVKPELVFATSTFGEFPADQSDKIWSPWDSVAARLGQTVVYETTDRIDLCPHLRSRITGPCSAVCLPLTVQGKLLGVLYALGPQGETPSDEALGRLGSIARRTALHIGLTRKLTRTDEQPDRDDDTALPTRRTVQERLRELDRTQVSYSLALCRIDDAAGYATRFGTQALERAVRLLADTVEHASRANDLAARVGSEEFAVVLPDTTAAIALQTVERLREQLIINQATRPNPVFTCSFSVAHSSTAGGGANALARAAQALERAQSSGRDRVMLANSPARNETIQ